MSQEKSLSQIVSRLYNIYFSKFDFRYYSKFSHTLSLSLSLHLLHRTTLSLSLSLLFSCSTFIVTQTCVPNVNIIFHPFQNISLNLKCYYYSLSTLLSFNFNLNLNLNPHLPVFPNFRSFFLSMS